MQKLHNGTPTIEERADKIFKVLKKQVERKQPKPRVSELDKRIKASCKEKADAIINKSKEKEKVKQPEPRVPLINKLIKEIITEQAATK